MICIALGSPFSRSTAVDALTPEVRYKRSLERKLTPKEVAMSIYDNPDFFPPRDTNNGGLNPRASKGGRVTAQQIEAPSATISSEETLFDFNNTALPVSYTHLTLPTICSV